MNLWKRDYINLFHFKDKLENMEYVYGVKVRIITEFFEENLHTHTDWTGTRVETRFECESVEEFIDKFVNYIRENGAG